MVCASPRQIARTSVMAAAVSACNPFSRASICAVLSSAAASPGTMCCSKETAFPAVASPKGKKMDGFSLSLFSQTLVYIESAFD